MSGEGTVECRASSLEGVPWCVLRAAEGAQGRRTTPHAFTLIELMIVIAIMAIVMTMSAPAIYHIWHKESLRKCVQDVTDACEKARSLAVMRGSMAELVFHAGDGRFEVVGSSAPHAEGEDGVRTAAVAAEPNAPGSTTSLSGQLPEAVGVAKLMVNGVNYMDADEARVRFYPNGTCDELRLILLQPKDGEVRGIFTEVTTSLVSVESDRFKLSNELR